jgi:hypothetical protein
MQQISGVWERQQQRRITLTNTMKRIKQIFVARIMAILPNGEWVISSAGCMGHFVSDKTRDVDK